MAPKTEPETDQDQPKDQPKVKRVKIDGQFVDCIGWQFDVPEADQKRLKDKCLADGIGLADCGRALVTAFLDGKVQMPTVVKVKAKSTAEAAKLLDSLTEAERAEFIQSLSKKSAKK